MNSALGLVLFLSLLVSTITDLAERKIYNWTTYPALLWAVGLSAISIEGSSDGWSRVLSSLAGATVCFAFVFAAYLLARGGAGDVKLAMVIGAVLGPRAGIMAVCIAYIVAAAWAACITISTTGPVAFSTACAGRLIHTLAPGCILMPTKDQRVVLERTIPLAPFFAIGTWVVIVC